MLTRFHHRGALVPVTGESVLDYFFTQIGSGGPYARQALLPGALRDATDRMTAQ